MANDKLKLITILQKHSSGKIPYESKYQIEETGEIIILKQKEGYPKVKFFLENGEEFDIQKYYNSTFIEIKKELNKPYYDEEVWNEFDKNLNSKQEKKEDEFSYFDVTRLIEALPRFKEKSSEIDNAGHCDTAFDKPLPFISNANLYMLFKNCGFQETINYKEKKLRILELYNSKSIIGKLYIIENRIYFSPNDKKIGSEYNYEEDKSLGFYYSAENYLYIALETLERYSIHLEPLLTDNYQTKNEISYGYQADSALKTLFAFSCECYLKSLLLLEGGNIKDLKEIGHGLIELYTALEPTTMTEIYEYYKYEKLFNFDRIEDKQDESIEEFVHILSDYSLAFIDARYSAENSKNTNYEFLKELSFALRQTINNKQTLMLNSSPFYSEINEHLNRHLLG